MICWEIIMLFPGVDFIPFISFIFTIFTPETNLYARSNSAGVRSVSKS